MTTLLAAPRTPERVERVPVYFDPARISSPDDNTAPKPAAVENLLASFREHGQLVPGFVCSSPDLPPDMRLCLEGNTRLAVARLLNQPFWAFDFEREVPAAERIKLSVQFNHSRRVMSREEIADLAARFMELTGCTAAEAAKHLHVSAPTISRAFGDARILPALKPKAEQLGQSIRSLIAASPPALMGQAVDFALTPAADGKRPTRDAVSLFIVTRLSSKELANVSPDGWPFLFA
jgi:ParB-like chromosome segregation protein Spo0J